MAKKLKQWPEKKGPRAKYPWDQWLDGNVWLITQGADFACQLEAMRVQICIAARVRGFKVQTMTDKEECQIIFQVIGKRDK